MTTLEDESLISATSVDEAEVGDVAVEETRLDTRTSHAALITSVGKALRLLGAFRGATMSESLGVSELARRSGLPKSTVFRFLADLEEVGFVEREGNDYRLGMALFELGSRVPVCRPNGLRDISMHHLSQLHVRTGLSAHLGVLDGVEILSIARVSAGISTVKESLQPGTRRPAASTAMGKVILAFSERDVVRDNVENGLVRRTKYSITEPSRLLRDLSKARKQGIAMAVEESVLGRGCIAAPIMHEGQVVASVSASMRLPMANVPRVAAGVREAASAIARDYAERAATIW